MKCSDEQQKERDERKNKRTNEQINARISMICTIKNTVASLRSSSEKFSCFCLLTEKVKKTLLKLNQMGFNFFLFDLIVWMYGMPEGDCLCLKKISIRCEKKKTEKLSDVNA